MVIKAEAYCPKCLNDDGYSVALDYHEGSKEFVCQRDRSHVYVEDANGFLVSKKSGSEVPWVT